MTIDLEITVWIFGRRIVVCAGVVLVASYFAMVLFDVVWLPNGHA